MKKQSKKITALIMTVFMLMLSITTYVPKAQEKTETEATEMTETTGEQTEVYTPVEGRQRQEDMNSFRFKNGQPIEYSGELVGEENPVSSIGYHTFTDSKGVEHVTTVLAHGVDVSTWQPNIDWATAKASGLVDFAILRCGYGDNLYSQDDDTWLYNATECERLGIPYGVYLYSYAQNEAMAHNEAAHVLRLLQGRNVSLPVFLDMEDYSQLAIGNDMLAVVAKTFCDDIQAAGYDVGIYANTNWFENYLTNPVFKTDSWLIWCAQYYGYCQYEGAHDIWQYSSDGTIPGMPYRIDVNYWVYDNITTNGAKYGGYLTGGNFPKKDNITYLPDADIRYKSYIDGTGWEVLMRGDNQQSGTKGSGKRIEAISICKGNKLADVEGDISYQAYIQGRAWTDWVKNGTKCGEINSGKRIEAISVKLEGDLAKKYSVYYRVYVQGYGWLGWSCNGNPAGTLGKERRIESYQIIIVDKKNVPSYLKYSTTSPLKENLLAINICTQQDGWAARKFDGSVVGSIYNTNMITGYRLYNRTGLSGNIRYKSFVQKSGWMPWVANGNVSGSPDLGRRVEAIAATFTGEAAANYDLYYRTYVRGYGWLGWASNGTAAGTRGLSKPIYAIQFDLVKKDGKAPGSTANAYVR
ncbi:MAG: hypothetical protein IKO61_00045 [Lachnospiraceae bacterium]|nr:hypothetical protein [Lachnospiraceae bacterium]